MGLKPEVSIPVGLATVAVVYGVYQTALPNLADARVSAPDDPDLKGAENNALFLGVAACAAVSLIAKDATPFILGGVTAVLLSWSHRYARVLNPATGKVDATPMGANLKVVSTTASAG